MAQTTLLWGLPCSTLLVWEIVQFSAMSQARQSCPRASTLQRLQRTREEKEKEKMVAGPMCRLLPGPDDSLCLQARSIHTDQCVCLISNSLLPRGLMDRYDHISFESACQGVFAGNPYFLLQEISEPLYTNKHWEPSSFFGVYCLLETEYNALNWRQELESQESGWRTSENLNLK